MLAKSTQTYDALKESFSSSIFEYEPVLISTNYRLGPSGVKML